MWRVRLVQALQQSWGLGSASDLHPTANLVVNSEPWPGLPNPPKHRTMEHSKLKESIQHFEVRKPAARNAMGCPSPGWSRQDKLPVPRILTALGGPKARSRGSVIPSYHSHELFLCACDERRHGMSSKWRSKAQAVSSSSAPRRNRGESLAFAHANQVIAAHASQSRPRSFSL